ncbi:MAG: CHAT domain-containing protein [Bacteroidetes bacterium]|nr:CHAT domain-containing protein [Bacteroidota bacterium]
MTKYPVAFTLLIFLFFKLPVVFGHADSIVVSTFFRWDSISNEVTTACANDFSLKCFEHQLESDKNFYHQAYLDYQHIVLLDYNGEYEDAKQILNERIANISPDQIDYFDYKFLELALYKSVNWGESDKSEAALSDIVDFFESIQCDSLFDKFTIYRKGGELYIIHLDMPVNAEVYFQKALQFWEMNQLDSAWLPPLLYDFAALRNERQEHEIAKAYIVQAEQIALKNPAFYGSNFLNKCRSLLAIIYGGSHQEAEAIEQIEQIIAYKNQQGSTRLNELMIDYMNLISYLIIEKRYQEALDQIKIVESFVSEMPFQGNTDLLNIAIAKARAYRGIQAVDKAKNELALAEKWISVLPQNEQAYYIFVLVTERVKLLRLEGKIEDALEGLYSIEFGEYAMVKKFLKGNQSWEIEYFILFGDLLDESQKNGITELDPYKLRPLDFYNKADSVINQLRTNNSWRNSSNYIVEHYRNLTEKLLDHYYQEYETSKDQRFLVQVFDIMERNQALLINERVNQQSLKGKFDINSEIVQLLQTKEILESKVAKLGRTSDKIKLDQLNKRYTDEINKLQTNFSKLDLIRLEDWRKKLKKEQSNWIEYFQGEDAVYVLFSADGQLDFKRIDFNERLKEDVNSIVNVLRRHDNNDFMSFEKAAHNLQQSLIPESVVTSNLKELVIVQDGLLYFLPFEVLLLSKEEHNNFKVANYLLRHKNIRYSLSASLWQTTVINNRSGILFALYNDQLNPLQAAATEVKKIQVKWKHKCWEASSKNDFLSLLEQSNIIHVAAHAAANTDLLSKNQLYFCDQANPSCVLESYELVPFDLSNKLVVLNGCETNYGKVIKGEGIFSWVRDFAVNGALTSISNLWKVSDLSAEQILTDTYTHWQGKKILSQSLQQSKLDYLEQSHPLMAHPFYWANTIIIGEAQLESKRTYIKTISITIVLLMVIILIYFSRITKPQGNKQ